MIEWTKAKDTRPADNQECFITATPQGLQSVPIIGPIVYKADFDGFIDLFATPEAGASYPADKEGHLEMWWCAGESINLPGDDEEETPDSVERKSDD